MGRKSAKIASRKNASDKLKSQIYTKALRDVTVAVKGGGPLVESNFLLKIALERCKKFNVPKDNIDKAIKKAQGGDGADYQDMTYEGYGAGGVAIFVEASTNNVTRTVANIRMHFNKNGGTLGNSGSLQFIYDRKSVFTIPKEKIADYDDFMLNMIDAGAEEVELEGDMYEVIGPMESFGSIQNQLQAMNITPEEASLQRIPTTFKKVDDPAIMAQLEKLIDTLEEDEDVTQVYHNIEAEE